MFAAEIRRWRVDRMRAQYWRWHLNEVFVKINGITHCLWRAVDHEGELLESVLTKTRDRKAALKFLRKSMKRHGRPLTIVTDRLRSCGSGACEHYRSSPQSMPRSTTTSRRSATSRTATPTSKPAPPLSQCGAAFSLPDRHKGFGVTETGSHLSDSTASQSLAWRECSTRIT